MKNFSARNLIVKLAVSTITLFTIIATTESSKVYASMLFLSSSPSGWSVGSNGTATSQVKTPLGIAYDSSSGNVFIVDTNNHRVKKLDGSTGAYIAHLGGTASGTGNSQFKSPEGIAVDSSGNVYVADTSNHRVQKLTNALAYSSTIGTTPLTSGSGNGQFSSPRGIVVDASGNIYVVDSGNSRVQIFNSSGTYVSQFGSAGTGNGQFTNPRGIALDASGNIYVADTNNHRIQKFDSSGNYLTKFGTGTNVVLQGGGAVTSAAFGTLSYPYDVAVGTDGTIYVANYANAVSTQGSIQRISSSGTFMMPLMGITNPGGIDVDASDNVYINETWLYHTIKYAPTATKYQISNLAGNLNATDNTYGANIETGSGGGATSVSTPVRLKTTSGLTLSDVTVDMSADRDWASVTGDNDRPSGKAVVGSLIGAPGAAATHTLYVPVPYYRTSQSVYICPDATTLTDVTTSCTNGVRRTAGSYTESFGNIVVSQVDDLGDNVTYWKITGMTGSGALADELVTFSGAGAGTVESPYEITTCDQFQSMKDLAQSHFKIMNSIDCSATSGWNGGKGFIPIGTKAATPFVGSLEGNAAYTVSGIYIEMTDVTAVNGIGVFGYTDGATFSEVHLTGLHITKGGYDADSVGGLIGSMKDGSITNSSIEGAIEQTSGNQDIDYAWVDNFGGMVGLATGTITISNSSTDVDITLLSGSEGIGGMVGQSRDNVTISDSSTTGFIHSSYNAYQTGGFIGWQLGSTTITNCFSTGEVHVGIGSPANTGDNYDIGGFVGGLGGAPAYPTTNSSIANSYSTGNVIVDGESNYDAGGFVGTVYDGGTITDSHSTGDVSELVIDGVGYSSLNAVGGFAGLTRQRFTNAAPSITNSYSTGTVRVIAEASDVGGFVGEHRNGTITSSYATGNVIIGVTGQDTMYSWGIGGFVGVHDAATIQSSYATGSISGVGQISSAGGFVGQFNGSNNGTALINKSYSTGNVNAYDTAGGFVGYMRHNTGGTETISNSYSRGNVSIFADYTDASAGGFAGYIQAVNLTNVYSTGTVTSALASTFLGGLVGDATTPTVTNSYWDTESSSVATSPVGTGHTTTQMKTQGDFTGWDFATIWRMNGGINNGYPILVYQAPPADAPTVSTDSILAFQQTMGMVIGNVSSDGGGVISERGIVYSSSNATPTTSDSKATSTGTTGSMVVRLSGLTPATLYYVRAYATNETTTAYGSVLTFTTLSPNLSTTSTVITSPVHPGNEVTLRSLVKNLTSTTGTGVTFTNTLAAQLTNTSASVTTATEAGLFSVTTSGTGANPDWVRKLNPTTLAEVSHVAITIPGKTVRGVYGIATHPSTLVVYMIVRVGPGNNTDTFDLATVNPNTGVGVDLGTVTGGGPPVALKIAGIAFKADGTLYAVTGDGDANYPESLFTVNTSTAVATLVMALGNGNDGESIAFGDDGMLYHASGYGSSNNVVFEKIDVGTLAITNIPITGDLDIVNIQGLSYKGAGEFYAAGYRDSDNADVIATLSVTGERYNVIVVDHTSKGVTNAATPVTGFSACTVNANVITCDLGTMRSTALIQASYTVDTLGTVPNNATDGTQYVNTAEVALGTTELVLNNNSAQSTITVSANSSSAPTVTTGVASSVNETTATIAGNVTSDGGATVTERGIVYSSTATTPTTANSKQTTTGTTGAMNVGLTGLSRATTYYARAYAINSQGTSYGSVVSFKTLDPASLRNVYYTFAKLKYNKYAAPAAIKTGDTAYIKNYNTNTLKLLQVFLYDYAKHGNQEFIKSKASNVSMFLQSKSLLPTGKRYAFVMKFQDKATGLIASKYFVFYTTKTWNGQSVLGVKTTSTTGTPTPTATPEVTTPELLGATPLATEEVSMTPVTTNTVVNEESKETAKDDWKPIVIVALLALVGVGYFMMPKSRKS